jgi:Phosphate-selective porin O and P
MCAKLMRVALTICVIACFGAAHAEPYLAVQQGLKCSQCHVNPTGAGMRNAYGNAFAQTQLAATRIATTSDATGDSLWTGAISQMLAIGGNLRADATVTQIPNEEQTRAFELQQARLYVNVAVVPNRVSVYLDELVAPGASTNREAFVRYQSEGDTWSVKAGQMYLPFGLRLQDDTAFIRQISGINMSTPDTGVEFNWEPGAWSTQFAISNGSAGGAETDTGKQYSLQGGYIKTTWRAGIALNLNDSAAGDRRAYGIFGGLKTGPIAWLGELDYVVDEILAGGNHKTAAGLIEANWRIRQGHNLKVTGELFDPDRSVSNDQQARYSVLYEYTPIQFLQLRGGIRYYDGIPQNDLQNRRVYFLEFHGYY